MRIEFNLDTVMSVSGEGVGIGLPASLHLSLPGCPWGELPGLLGEDSGRLETALASLLRDGRAFQTYAKSPNGVLLRYCGEVSGLHTSLTISRASAAEATLNADLMRVAELEAQVALLKSQRNASPVALFQVAATGALEPKKDNAREALTGREQTILLQLAQGKSNKQVALALDISVRTVETPR